MAGFLYRLFLANSSISFGVTQTTYWPFQYLVKFITCNVPTMSPSAMLVIELKSEENNLEVVNESNDKTNPVQLVNNDNTLQTTNKCLETN